MAEKEYIEREAVNALIKAECSPKVAAYLIDAVATIHAADVGWIPVTERLPEMHDVEYLDEATGELVRYKESMPVLIWLAKGGFMDIGIYEKSDAVDDFCYQGIPHTVTYWMPLPDAPEEGE